MVEQASTIVADDTADTTTADTTSTAATTTAATTADAGKKVETGATTAADTTTADTTAAADDWRARMADGDEKLLGYLGRYQSEKAFVEAAKKDRDVARTANASKLPENPTDEEVAAYRKAQGVPDKPDAYLTTLPDGLVVGEDDKPFVDQFLTNMHTAGAPPTMVNAALETYYAIVDEQIAAQSEAANGAKNASIEALREEWGPDYRRNLNVMTGFLDTLPPEVAEVFKFGKGADGLPIGYNAPVLKWLTAQAMESNPLATVVPGAGANQASAVADEIAALENRMTTDRNAYFKDEKAQARYLQLIEARDKIAERGG